MPAISDERYLGNTAPRMAIRTRESNFEKRQFSIKAGREAGLYIRLKSLRFKTCQEELLNTKQILSRAKHVAVIHIAASPALPEKLVEGMVQPVQIGNRRKLVHLIAQCQISRFAAIEGGDIEEA